ncbi:DUF3253 domain-containing protein [Wenxinia marina]|uniref:DUF3253 domain-containing protein n=1 Tax=Wenxinia marina DSM 24838 TaxID=1123501 RepID=A0A0D0PDT5_9RHOB|nr:DUF3253 domain-containing protein [Wenxinia marina]KIQ69596.1 hypothetical protein Wenmar_01960 [Wenxinia marina DSM 24838]GGL59619.1 hypothetical protein GCM10011392_12650 [Wenxinia marina]
MDDEIAETLMRLARDRAGRTFCPSEAARALAEDWRQLMDDVRRVAATLPLVATQGGAPVDPVTARGPIRLALDDGAGGAQPPLP